jgi:hypothetical protein
MLSTRVAVPSKHHRLHARSRVFYLLKLPATAAVRGYPIGKGVEPSAAEAGIGLPSSAAVTKRGALVFARKDPY